MTTVRLPFTVGTIGTRPHTPSYEVVELAGPLVPVGDDGLYMDALVRVRVDLAPPGSAERGPIADVTVVVDQQGRPGVHEMRITARDPRDEGAQGFTVDWPIADSALRALSLTECVRMAVWLAARAANGEWGAHESADRDDAAEAAARGTRRRRTEVTPQRLRAVVLAFREGGAHAVQRRLHVGQSQAYRLIAQARDAGLIQPPHQEDEQ